MLWMMCDRYAIKECKGIAGSKKVCKKAQPIPTLRKLFGRRYHAVKKSAAAKNWQRYELRYFLSQFRASAIDLLRMLSSLVESFINGIISWSRHTWEFATRCRCYAWYCSNKGQKPSEDRKVPLRKRNATKRPLAWDNSTPRYNHSKIRFMTSKSWNTVSKIWMSPPTEPLFDEKWNHFPSRKDKMVSHCLHRRRPRSRENSKQWDIEINAS